VLAPPGKTKNFCTIQGALIFDFIREAPILPRKKSPRISPKKFQDLVQGFPRIELLEKLRKKNKN